MRFLVSPGTIASRGFAVGGILIAEHEFTREPQHITVVGGKDDAAALALFRAALLSPSAFKRVEWYDAREGPLPRHEVEYPALSHAAAFFCTAGRCSPPLSSVTVLEKKLSPRASESSSKQNF